MRIGEHAEWDKDYEVTKGYLHERERLVWEYRRQGLSMDAIATLIGRTRERIRQIENKAARKIKFYRHHANAAESTSIVKAFSARVSNNLLEHGCETLDDVRKLVDANELKNVAGMGRTSENEVRAFWGYHRGSPSESRHRGEE